MHFDLDEYTATAQQLAHFEQSSHCLGHQPESAVPQLQHEMNYPDPLTRLDSVDIFPNAYDNNSMPCLRDSIILELVKVRVYPIPSILHA